MGEQISKSDKGPSSLSRAAFKAVCSRLEKSITAEKASASFACGGIIPVKGSVEEVRKTVQVKPSGPINVFWARKDEPGAQQLILPLGVSVPLDDSPNSPARLRQLVADCEEAEFGRGQESVLDPKYRKAGKLAPHQFASSFHPADFGIVERVEQVLLPTLNELDGDLLKIRRMGMELYKLNVYSGPSGLFKSHVDTPRSDNQIGSLVVCLPSPFQGGNLIVRHEGRTVDFDWQHKSAETIQWAAFYSDCEHEIKTITQGERITLTYNLYAVTESLDKGNPLGAIVDPRSLPLYGEFRSLLGMPGFMAKGGVLGSFCSHAYPHASSDVSVLLPGGLKGADLVLYSVLHSLGIEVEVLPVVIGHGYKERDHWSETEFREEDGEDGEDGESDTNNTSGRRRKDDKKEKKRKMDDDACYTYYEPAKKARVGSCLRPYVSANTMGEESFTDILNRWWPTRKYEKNITWITAPRPENLQEVMTFIAYGNEATQAQMYSYAAIIAVIPSWDDRQNLLEKLEG